MGAGLNNQNQTSKPKQNKNYLLNNPGQAAGSLS